MERKKSRAEWSGIEIQEERVGLLNGFKYKENKEGILNLHVFYTHCRKEFLFDQIMTSFKNGLNAKHGPVRVFKFWSMPG